MFMRFDEVINSIWGLYDNLFKPATQESENIVDSTRNLLINLANNENYINITSIIIVAFTTYRVTKYTTLKPERMKIKQAQLENVYLPLFLLLNEMPTNVAKSQALTYSKKISNILEKHYLLAFPQLHQLSRSLKKEIIADKNYGKTLRIIKHQVEIDYELLKKTLGYPSENFPDLFLRMTFKQKYVCISPWIEACWISIPFAIAFCFKNILGKYFLIVFFFLALLFSLLLRKLNDYINSMSD